MAKKSGTIYIEHDGLVIHESFDLVSQLRQPEDYLLHLGIVLQEWYDIYQIEFFPKYLLENCIYPG